jgi:hypothetical protein
MTQKHPTTITPHIVNTTIIKMCILLRKNSHLDAQDMNPHIHNRPVPNPRQLDIAVKTRPCVRILSTVDNPCTKAIVLCQKILQGILIPFTINANGRSEATSNNHPHK